jgi:hypothetical protein
MLLAAQEGYRSNGLNLDTGDTASFSDMDMCAWRMERSPASPITASVGRGCAEKGRGPTSNEELYKVTLRRRTPILSSKAPTIALTDVITFISQRLKSELVPTHLRQFKQANRSFMNNIGLQLLIHSAKLAASSD